MWCQLQTLHKIHQLADRKFCHLSDIFVPDSYGQSLRLQTFASTLCTWRDPHKTLIFFFHALRSTFPVTSLDIFDDPLKCHIIYSDTSLSTVLHLDHSAIGTVHQHMTDLLRKLLIWRIDIKSIRIRQRIKYTPAVAAGVLC